MIPFLLPAAAAIITSIAVLLFLLVRYYHVAKPGTALVISSGSRTPRVLWEGGVVAFPGLISVDAVDMTERRFELSFTGASALPVKGGARLAATIELRCRPTEVSESLLRVMKELGAARLNDAAALQKHFSARLSASAIELSSATAEVDLESAEFSERLSAAFEKQLVGFTVDSATLRLER